MINRLVNNSHYNSLLSVCLNGLDLDEELSLAELADGDGPLASGNRGVGLLLESLLGCDLGAGEVKLEAVVDLLGVGGAVLDSDIIF